MREDAAALARDTVGDQTGRVARLDALGGVDQSPVVARPPPRQVGTGVARRLARFPVRQRVGAPAQTSVGDGTGRVARRRDQFREVPLFVKRGPVRAAEVDAVPDESFGSRQPGAVVSGNGLAAALPRRLPRRAVQLVGVGAPHVERIVVPRALERDVVVTRAPALWIVGGDADVPVVRRWTVFGPAHRLAIGRVEAQVIERRRRLVPEARQHLVLSLGRGDVLGAGAASSHPQRVRLPQRLHRRAVTAERAEGPGGGGESAGEGLRDGEAAARRHDPRRGARGGVANLASLRGDVDEEVLTRSHLVRRVIGAAPVRAEEA